MHFFDGGVDGLPLRSYLVLIVGRAAHAFVYSRVCNAWCLGLLRRASLPPTLSVAANCLGPSDVVASAHVCKLSHTYSLYGMRLRY